jgi:polysaccharide biosynthesis/export protein
MKQNIIQNCKCIILILFVFLISSCVPVKEISYFNDINNLQEPPVNPRRLRIIMPLDKLYIKVLSIDDKTLKLFNSTESINSSTSINIVSYTVDKDGNINYPFIGTIKLGGLTTAEASSKLEKVLNEYVTGAGIVITIIDNNVTLLGEVKTQGMYTFNQDNITIYDALALGGGLTQYGNRKKVILIRQEGNRIIHQRLDLSDSRIADKEYYYIKANDIIVVEPIKAISYSYGNNTAYLIMSSISLVLTILLFFGI